MNILCYVVPYSTLTKHIMVIFTRKLHYFDVTVLGPYFEELLLKEIFNY